MVDEYQDTNAAQFQLVHHLTSAHRNLCVVGDDDQSIYGWRGAETANLLDLEKHFPGVKVVKLEQNYRSTNTILSAANAVIKNNARRRGKHLWSQKGDGRANHPARLRQATRRRRAAPPKTSNSPAWPAAFRGATRPFCFAPTSSRARWKPPCARPASATTWSAAKVILTGARSRISWPT